MTKRNRSTFNANATDATFTEKVEATAESVRTPYASYFVEVPSIGRTIAAFLVTFCTSFGIAAVADPLINTLAIAALLVTGSTFIGWCVFVVGWVAAFVAAFYTGAFLGDYVFSRRVDDDFKTAKAKVSSAWSWAKSKVSRDEPAVVLH